MSNQTQSRKAPPRPPVSRHGGTPVRMKGEKLDFKVIKRLFGLVDKKYMLLMALVFVCIFAMYVKNDLAPQVDFSVEGFALPV